MLAACRVKGRNLELPGMQIRYVSKHSELLAGNARGTELRKFEWRHRPIQAVSPGEGLERLADLIGQGAGAAHAAAELRFVQLAVARLSNGRLDARRTRRLAAGEPFEKDRTDRTCQPQQDASCSPSARFFGGLEDRWDLAIVESGDDWGDHHARGNAG